MWHFKHLPTLWIISVCLWIEVSSQAANLTGCKVISLTPSTEDDYKVIQSVLYTRHPIPGTELWSYPSPTMSEVILQVCRNAEDLVTSMFRNTGVKISVNIEDLQNLIDEQMSEIELQGRFDKSSGFNNFGLGQYHNLQEVYDFLEVASKEHPDKLAIASIGRTYENRKLTVVRVGTQSNINKPAIFISSGLHSREWISIASTLYVIHKLVSCNDSSTEQLLRMYDWYFVPVGNPDGYAYTWSKGDVRQVSNQEYFHPRLWRKNRSKSRRSICIGVDLNRNFDIDHTGTKSSSSQPCSQVYRGTKAFSESETWLLSNYLMALKNRLKTFVDIHSFGQMWMTPYGYKGEKSKDHVELLKVANLAVSTLEQVHGTKYRVGTISDTVYGASGNSVDWVHDVVGIKYTYAVELRDKGKQGFLLSQDNIIPTSKELYVALLKMANEIANRELNNVGSKQF